MNIRLLTSLLLVGSLVGMTFAEPVKSLEFRNQDLRDILLSFGTLNRVSIVPDETVEGKASYVFSNVEFDQALQLFLGAFRLSASYKGGVYYVSKVAISGSSEGDLDVSAFDVPLTSIIRALSAHIGKTILYDSLPMDLATVNVHHASADQVLQILIAKYPDFHLETKEKYFFIRYKPRDLSSLAKPLSGTELTVAGDRYAWNVDQAQFRDLLMQLFAIANKQVVLLIERDAVVQNLKLKDLSFSEALKALLLFGNGDYVEKEQTYTVFEVQRRDLLKKYLINVVLPFEHITTADFLRLLPPSLNSGTMYRVDEKTNKLILSGSPEEIQPLWDFFRLVDKSDPGTKTLRVELQYLKYDEFLPLLPSDYVAYGPQALPSRNGFVLTLPASKVAELQSFLQMVDRPTGSRPLRLRYLKSEELISKLPPSVTEANVVRTNDPSLIFFKGSDSQLKSFLADLDALDLPRPLLRYEILVLQFEEGKGLNLASNLSLQSGANSNAFSGQMGKLLGFNFDIVGNFGIGFGLDLSASLSDNNTKVVADTTLNGLSGEKISFQNTNTFRYTDNQIDPATGKPYPTGVVRELSSGLLLNLEGWISADNMITLKVDTTLSKQSQNSSGPTNAPPSTSEKKISTLVRTLSGKPLVIGGLKQEDNTEVVSKTPVLGDIPWIGLLFQQRSEAVTRTEFSLYIVPILERAEWTNLSDEAKAGKLYSRFHPETP